MQCAALKLVWERGCSWSTVCYASTLAELAGCDYESPLDMDSDNFAAIAGLMLLRCSDSRRVDGCSYLQRAHFANARLTTRKQPTASQNRSTILHSQLETPPIKVGHHRVAETIIRRIEDLRHLPTKMDCTAFRNPFTLSHRLHTTQSQQHYGFLPAAHRLGPKERRRARSATSWRPGSHPATSASLWRIDRGRPGKLGGCCAHCL